MKRIRFCCFFWIPCILLLFTQCRSSAELSENIPPGAFHARATLLVEGARRSYILYLPASFKASLSFPLVVALHGGRGSGEVMEKASNLNSLAEQENFAVVYPDGIDRQWNDGRLEERKEKDVLFIQKLIESLVEKFSLDSHRVYAVGVSNGGMMCQRLACEIPEKLAGVASIISSMPQNIHKIAKPSRTISVLLFNGTKDPLVPWEGGDVKFFQKKLGKIISTEEAVQFWIKHNQCSSSPQISQIPKKNSQDVTSVEKRVWGQGKDGTEVILYTVQGGGHTWPGGSQYLPEWTIGKTNRDMNAFSAIWEFFKKHRR